MLTLYVCLEMNILFYILAAILVYMITVSLERRNAIIGFGEMSYSVKDENAIQINSPLPLMYDYKIKDNETFQNFVFN